MKNKWAYIRYKFFHWLFDWLLPWNSKQAKINDEILINFRCLRYPGKCATVIELDKLYWESYATKKIVCAHEKGLAKIKFPSGLIIYNLNPKDYWIIKKNKNKT